MVDGFDKGIKRNERRPIEGMNGTHIAHHKAGQGVKVAGIEANTFVTPGRKQKPQKYR